MATKVYLRADEIKRRFENSAYVDWIECSSVHRNIMKPHSAYTSSNCGHTAECCQLDKIMLNEFAHLLPPIRRQTRTTGKTIPKAKFEFTRTDGDDKQLKHVETGLENLLISQAIPCIESASRLPKNVCLTFAKVKWKYSKQKIGGGAGGQTMCGWDLSQNKIG